MHEDTENVKSFVNIEHVYLLNVKRHLCECAVIDLQGDFHLIYHVFFYKTTQTFNCIYTPILFLF